MKAILDEVEKAAARDGAGAILFIDELDRIMTGAGGDAASLFKPLLTSGRLRFIGATTPSGYRKYIEPDGTLGRIFAKVVVNELAVPETVHILQTLKEKYESHHGVRIADGALISAATLAHRSLTSRKLPESAIDLLDEACASVCMTREMKPARIDSKVELGAGIHALERDKDSASKKRLRSAQKAIAEVEKELQPRE